ncbi:hypothetical protein PMZ82_21555, partial [[Clostridium] symbiosum]
SGPFFTLEAPKSTKYIPGCVALFKSRSDIPNMHLIASPFYKGVTVAEYQVIVVELFTCVPIKSPPAAVIIR